jgi:hypothetical protein
VIVSVPATGCADTCQTEIASDVAKPACTVAPAVDTVCEGEFATFCIIPSAGKPPYSFSWSGPNLFASSDSCITVSNPGLYRVVLTGTNGCKDTCEAILFAKPCGGGKITPTNTDCDDFVDGTADDLTEVYYGVKKSLIHNTHPGVFFYYTQVTAPSPTFTVDIMQTKDNVSFPYFGVHQDGDPNQEMRLFDAYCVKIGLGTETSPGQVSFNISGATPGQVFILSVKYETASLVGTVVSHPYPTVHFDFSTWIGGVKVDEDTNGLDLFKALGGPSIAGFNDSSNKMSLESNYPNPFNATTTIRYSLPTNSHVQLVVYNILGQKVRTLVDEEQQAGQHTATWDGRNQSGNQVASGVYFYRIQYGNQSEVRRMTLLR